MSEGLHYYDEAQDAPRSSGRMSDERLEELSSDRKNCGPFDAQLDELIAEARRAREEVKAWKAAHKKMEKKLIYVGALAHTGKEPPDVFDSPQADYVRKLRARVAELEDEVGKREWSAQAICDWTWTTYVKANAEAAMKQKGRKP